MYAKVTAMLRTNGEALDPIGAFRIPGVLRDWHSEIRRFFSEAKSFPRKPRGKTFIRIYNCHVWIRSAFLLTQHITIIYAHMAL